MGPLTNSEMAAWQNCHRGWWLSYYRGLRRKDVLPTLSDIGNLVHLGLEAYYRAMWKGTELPIPAEIVIARAEQLIEKHPDLADQIARDAEFAVIILDGYMDWLIAEGEDAGLRVVGAETMVEVDVGPFRLRGKIDARVVREEDGALVQLEHKTVANFTDLPKYAQSAPQFLNYDLIAYLAELQKIEDVRRTDGVLLNMLRRVKRTPRATPPFYKRHYVRHNAEELRSHYKHVIAIGEEIEAATALLNSGKEHHLVVPPNVDRQHTWQCACRDVTTLFDDGSDVESFLEEFYEKYDPLERYKGEAA